MEPTKESLLSAFYWIAVRTTHEVNSKRGLTKKTAAEEAKIIKQLVKAFGVNEDTLKSLIEL